MKKILFILLLVIGFSAQAQNPPGDQGTIEFTIFESGSTTYGVAIGDDINNRCVEVKAASSGNAAISVVGSSFVYSIDSNGQRYRGDRRLGSPQPNFVRTFSNGTFYRLYTRTGTSFGNARNIRE